MREGIGVVDYNYGKGERGKVARQYKYENTSAVKREEGDDEDTVNSKQRI